MRSIAALLLFILPAIAGAQTYPTCSPTAKYYTAEGEKEDASTGESAPLPSLFKSNPQDNEGWTSRYEWTIARQETPETPIVHRFDEDMEYTFTQSGTFVVTLRATFVQGNDTIRYGEPGQGDDNTFMVNIQQSVLELPNTFTPNGDGYNDVLRVKEGYRSIISFRAVVFNRWGMKLYEWNDLDGGWDGRYHGSVVKDGAYYLVVEAKGADGEDYKIRKAINVLTTSNNPNGNGTDQTE
ncbi:MAG: gliding motility-associated C-terminal domain-containing protein [Bacteroidaceae bacterium]|nr:gliding motility-associated C-terminal domain-containing protein [Bacteroidaceae bacterium]